ncbi:UNKNOWN [Stylonychia lemnae]|uniref:Uncharacterized protein n=1 Tax=Stylonychia lemnae TaxID=5949 RepID=A0A078B9Q7_STYLE|nr:UNKNOWN [Stylonychia lemnae]|eukprot:CDW89987.1 UNKNOWN [Stylonychia lemnae]
MHKDKQTSRQKQSLKSAPVRGSRHYEQIPQDNIAEGEPVYDPQEPVYFYKNTYGGTLPIGSMRLLKREKRKRRLQYLTKSLFFGGSIGLIIISALRFTAVQEQTVHEAIMDFYYLFFGVVVALSQLNVHKVADQFRFLNYYWGKGIFCMFLASISFSNKEEAFVQWIMTVYFFITAAMMFILALLDRTRDVEQGKIDWKIIEKTYVENDNEGGIDFERLPFANYFKQKLSKHQRRNNHSLNNNTNSYRYGINQDDEVMQSNDEHKNIKQDYDIQEVIESGKGAYKSYQKGQQLKRALDSSF